ncbi:mechanosensitive ion channel family protein [Haliangium sp.]|uniref:mechanosensitive ion channel family protein n=1 Tax=Haliangium sp. TaxID=2663208 RepID=UPI003D0AD31D
MNDVAIQAEAVWEYIISFATSYGIQIIGALLILLIGRIAAGIAKKSIERVMNLRKVDSTIVSFVASLAYFGILTVAVLAALSKFGIQTTSFIAVLGAAGFAVGLALQGSLSNFASGVLILIFRPFKVGDYIKAGGAEGEVRHIHLFVTELATLDNIKVIVPNSGVMGGNISNLSGYDKRRVDMHLGISYGSSIGKAKEVAEKVMSEDPRVLADPAPTIVVKGWGDSSVDIVAVPWVDPKDYWAVFFDMHRKLKEAFDEAGIEIPFPQRVVHMAKDDTDADAA